jgi:hypothetical protein
LMPFTPANVIMTGLPSAWARGTAIIKTNKNKRPTNLFMIHGSLCGGKASDDTLA